MHTGDCVVTEGCGRVQVPPTYPSPPASLSWSAPGPSPLRAEFGAQPSLLPGRRWAEAVAPLTAVYVSPPLWIANSSGLRPEPEP